MKELKITSPAFKPNNPIPTKYTCDGENVNPPLNIEDIPSQTKTLTLIVDDPDAPMGTWTHWLVWNIPPKEKIAENSIPGIEGLNTARKHSYEGPCPPSGTHHYHFKIYALDTELELNPNSKKEDVEKAMQNHILAKGETIGLYQRK